MILSDIFDISSCKIEILFDDTPGSLSISPEWYVDGVYNLFFLAELLDARVNCIDVLDQHIVVYLKTIPEGCESIEDNPFK